MSRRKADGRYGREHSKRFIAFTWLCSFLSLGLLYLTGNAVVGNFKGLRSCSTNSSGLTVVNCGKGSLNITDIAMIGIFMLVAVLVVTLFTGAWRLIRGRE